MTTVSPENGPASRPTLGRYSRWREGVHNDPRVRWWQRIRSMVVLGALVLLLGVVVATLLGAGLAAVFYFFEGSLN